MPKLALSVLQDYWGYDTFRDPQDKIVDSILQSKNVVGLLPTGAGKSICFQVPGMVNEGLTIVISPLVALMEDQVMQLKSRGIKATFLHSGLRRHELDILLDNVIYDQYKFLYMSPERISTEFFQARAHKMNVSLIAIDEAHCISQWGHDFRPAYLKIGELKDLFPDVPMAAFTATATADTLKDIKTFLNFSSVQIFRKSFAKDNLSYSVIKSTDKELELLYLLARIKGSGIIYVRSRKVAEELSSFLNKAGYTSDYYHAGLTYEVRKDKQQKWLSDEIQFVVSTNAFGMGIDKANVRWVIHMDVPNTLEEYYQEAGRAGRDGAQAYAMLIYDDRDEAKSLEMLELSQVNSVIVNEVYDKIFRFLGIPIGGGLGESHPFDINKFCRLNKYPVALIISVIKNLEKAEILVTTESIYKPSTLYFFDSVRGRTQREGEDTPFQTFIKTLIRNHEGLFSRDVKISEEKIARLTNTSSEQVAKYLSTINDLEIGKYTPRNDLPQLIFLTSRTEAKSLNLDYRMLDKLFEIKWDKLHHMLAYLSSNTCRENMILKYFDESQQKPCGRCDVCKGSAIKTFDHSEAKKLHLYLKSKIENEVPLFDLLHWWPLNKRAKVLEMLAFLENEKYLIINNQKVSLSDK